MLEGLVSGLGTLHQLLTLNFFSIWIRHLEKRKKCDVVMRSVRHCKRLHFLRIASAILSLILMIQREQPQVLWYHLARSWYTMVSKVKSRGSKENKASITPNNITLLFLDPKGSCLFAAGSPTDTFGRQNFQAFSSRQVAFWWRNGRCRQCCTDFLHQCAGDVEADHTDSGIAVDSADRNREAPHLGD